MSVKGTSRLVGLAEQIGNGGSFDKVDDVVGRPLIYQWWSKNRFEARLGVEGSGIRNLGQDSTGIAGRPLCAPTKSWRAGFPPVSRDRAST